MSEKSTSTTNYICSERFLAGKLRALDRLSVTQPRRYPVAIISPKPAAVEPVAREPAPLHSNGKPIAPRSEAEKILMRREAVQRRQNAEVAAPALIDAELERTSRKMQELGAKREVLRRKHQEAVAAEDNARRAKFEAEKELVDFENQYEVGHEELKRKGDALEKQHNDWMEKCGKDVEQLKNEVAKISKN